MRIAIHLFGVGVSCLLACGGRSVESTYEGAAPDVAGCAWPGGGQCSENRYYLVCKAGGAQQACLSSDPSQCPNAVSGLVCASQCNSSEYGAVCGASSSTPAGCRSAGAPTPGGTLSYCCPCAG